jgi:hypothetical protein
VSKLAVGQLEGLASEGYRISVASGSAFAPVGSILQVVSTAKTDTFSTSSTSFTDVTGLSVSITPKFSSSKILVMASVSGCGTTGVTSAFFRLMRDSTAIFVSTDPGSRVASSAAIGSEPLYGSQSIKFLDSTSSTSAITYKIQGQCQGGASSTVYVNRGYADTNSNVFTRTASSITVMEVAG